MSNRKYGKSRSELRQDHAVKVLTFDPLAKGWYRCHKTDKRLRRSQILSHMLQYVHGQITTIVKPGQTAPPKAKRGSQHPSKYRAKQR
jgi:hypothetical protein